MPRISPPGQGWWAAALDIVVGGSTVVAALVASPVLRRRYNRYGATDAEVASAMPGDALVKRPKLEYTRAITIDAPPAEVWPWLAQIGQGRGGLYSYDGLENLLGCDIHSANAILAEQQDLRHGNIVRSGPDTYPCWIVMSIDEPHHLVLLGAGTPADIKVPEIVDEVPAKGYTASTWQWELRPSDTGTRTRLVVRQRLTYSPGQMLIWRLVEPLNFVMEHKMLKGVRARAEQRSSSTTYDPSVSRSLRSAAPTQAQGN